MLRRARRNQARALLLQTTLVDVTCPSPMWQQLELDPLFPKRTFSLSFKLEKPRLFIHFPVSIAFENRLLAYCCDLITCTLSICRPWNDIYSVVSSEHFSLPNPQIYMVRGDCDGLNKLCSKIRAPSLRHLDFEGIFPSENEEPSMLDLLQIIIGSSLEALMIDYHNLTPDNALKSYTLTPLLRRLVLGQSPTERY